MVKINRCAINVYNNVNPWIDFCIIVKSYGNLQKTEEIVRKAYYTSQLPDVQVGPIADYIEKCLKENNIDYKIYFKKEEATE